MSAIPLTATNTDYTITDDEIPHSFKQGMAEIDLIARAEKAEFDLAHARVMVRVLRDACGIIERKAGEDYDERDPLSDIGDIATKALAATEETNK
jgi:hypothetical protein